MEASESGIGELYARNAAGGVRLAYLLTGDRGAAEDLFHDAFVRCAGRFAHLRSATAFDAYLRRAIVNGHLTWVRRRAVEREWLARERAAGERVDPGADAGLGEHEELQTALSRLPARQRAALVLRYYEDLSEADAAAAMRCSVPALKMLVQRGTATLRATLAQGDQVADDTGTDRRSAR